MRRLILLLTLASLAIAQRRGVTAEDYFAFEQAGDPQIAPDGKWVAYTVTTIDQKTNRRVSRIWIAALDGSHPPVPYTGEGSSSTSPRWSPDGRFMAFLSSRAEGLPGTGVPQRAQIWILSRNGGEARRLSNLENGISSIEWSPDSTRILGLTRTGPPSSKNSDVRHYTHSNYKFNDTGWFDEKRSHVVVVDAKTGTAKQITDGDNWNNTDPHWSPDSTRIAFVSNRTGHEFDGDHNADVWVVSATGGALAKISDHEGPDRNPRWSPDGKQIAFLGSADEEDAPLIYVASADGGKSKAINSSLDQVIGEIDWAERGKAIYFDSGVNGETHVYRMDASTGAVKPLTTGARNVHGFAHHEDEMVYLANDFEHLEDVYVSEAGK